MFTAKSLTKSLVPVLGLAALALGANAHAQVINYTASTTLSAGAVNGVTLETNTAADNGVNALGLGTADTVGGFRVLSAGASPAAYTSGFTTTLVITDLASGQTKNLITTGTVSVTASSSQVTPGTSNVSLSPATFSIGFPTNTYFVQLERFDAVGAQGSQNFGSFSYRFSTVAVPEPGAVAMMVGMGVSGLGFLARRKRAAK